MRRSAQARSATLSGFLADPFKPKAWTSSRFKFAQTLQQLAADAAGEPRSSQILQADWLERMPEEEAPASASSDWSEHSSAAVSQAGGQVSGGRPILVGERGPEIFTPPGAGAITPNINIDQAAQAPPVVNVVNAIDPSEITGAFNSGEGDKVLLNRISAKRTSFRAALGV